MRIGNHLTALLIAAGLCTVPVSSALAALGGTRASIAVDQKRLGGSLQSCQKKGYIIETLHTTGGDVLQQFVSPSGVVFGFVWKGFTRPDMRALLGASFATFQKAAASQWRPRQPLKVRTKDLVVQMAGRLRRFYVRAYLPASLPPGVSAEVIQ